MLHGVHQGYIAQPNASIDVSGLRDMSAALRLRLPRAARPKSSGRRLLRRGVAHHDFGREHQPAEPIDRPCDGYVNTMSITTHRVSRT